MKVKLLKGFSNGGRWLNQGDDFEGTPDEIDDLVRQGYAEKPKEEPKAPAPPPPTKVKLVKGFNNRGRQLNPGDEFEGSPDEIDDLVRQGYAEKPPEEEKGAHPPQQEADDPPDNPPAPQHESQHGQHEHSASARTGPTKKHTK